VRATAKGFSLIELLIALTLSTMVMLMLSMGMSFVLNEWTRSSNRLETSIDKVLVLLQIERALQGAYPHLYRDVEENKDYIFFEGDEEQISWVSTVSPGRKPGLTAWQLLPSEEKDGLEIRIVPAFAGDPTERLEEYATSTTVLEAYSVSFEYLYIDEKLKDDTKWLKEWSAKTLQSLPYAVRVSLESEDDTADSIEIIAMIQAHQHPKLKPIKP
jgi:general secretion pathway protein J